MKVCLPIAHLSFLSLCPHLGLSPGLSWCKSVLLLLWHQLSSSDFCQLKISGLSCGILVALSFQKQNSSSLHWFSPSEAVSPKLHSEINYCSQKKAGPLLLPDSLLSPDYGTWSHLTSVREVQCSGPHVGGLPEVLSWRGDVLHLGLYPSKALQLGCAASLEWGSVSGGLLLYAE